MWLLKRHYPGLCPYHEPLTTCQTFNFTIDLLSFVSKKMKCDAPYHYHSYPISCEVVTNVVDPTSTPSHYNKSLGYDHHIPLFINLEVKECIEHVSDKKGT